MQNSSGYGLNRNGPHGAGNTDATLTDNTNVGGSRMADGSQYPDSAHLRKTEHSRKIKPPLRAQVRAVA